ncbi:LysR family transcriptional regulator [Pseudomonas sp. LB-090624]|uniref:LysR family transcriptional regulator n=1 Tax=Pseudomonas sp. LB-090624 TaxID=2213079 RepID=UPI000DA0DA65|nr:LysR family transcriptional regulator [Pseudomonas sp. LB-090624]PYB78548.1 LysR family transcriptional regulator [Pseudomonas sp. LB-090624]
MDIRTLEAVISVIDNGSIASAAKKSNVSSTAISLRIQSLEKELECELFNRDAHSIRPNQRLIAVTQKIRDIILQANELKFDLQLDDLRGDLNLGAISTALTGIIPSAIEQFSVCAPDVKLKITPGDSKLLYDKLVGGELDAAILVEPPFKPPKSVRLCLLRAEPLGLLSGTPVTADAVLSALETQPFIRYDVNSWGGSLAQRYLDDRDIDVRVGCDIDSLEAIDLLVSYGQGVSLVPQWLTTGSFNAHYIPVSQDTRYSRNIVLAYSESNRNLPALQRLREVLTAPLGSAHTA